MTTTETNILADHTVARRLGNWTRHSALQVRARSGKVVLDLRSPEIDGDIDITLDLQRSVVTLLVTDDASIDQWELRLAGHGRVKDAAPGRDGTCLRLHGYACDSQVRIQRAGVAELTGMLSLSRLKEMHRAHQAIARER